MEAQLKSMQPKSLVNLVTPVAQALEMAYSEIKHKQEEIVSIMGGERMIATMDWNSLRYLRMNSNELHGMLLGYPFALQITLKYKEE